MNAEKIKVLVVDDDEAVRSLAGRILRREGYDVLEASDAEEAIAMSRDSGGVGLLLTDVVLPGQSGADLAEALQGDNAELKVVFMSGYSEDEIEGQGIDQVGAAYITKPFTAEVLTLMVRGATDS